MMKRLGTTLLAAGLFLAIPAKAQFIEMGTEKSAIKEGFALPKDGPVRVIVFRPDVHVGEQTTGGLNEPNADWTKEARDALHVALEKTLKSRSNEMKLMPELSGDDDVLMADYRSMFKAIADAAITHKLFPGNRLPTKKDEFDWTMGSGTAKLGELGGGDYGLFFYTYDSYGSAGRKAMQAVGMIMGFGVTSGVHIGYAGLVDLKTGDLVWINADVKMGGDVRDAEGAEKRISQLLEDFPAREGSAPAHQVGK
ncbi:MAG: hypothetical protein ABI668_05055 [Sphingorhabdus sp.]